MDKGFDERWRRNPAPQATTAPVFWAKTGWGPNDLRGKTVLDAGCGCGRFTQVAERHADKVIGIDTAPHALKAARENTDGADIREDDLLDIQTVAPESIDMAFALGTLHHTGDTRKAFAEVAKTVKVGGRLAVWLYCRPSENNELLPVIDMLHEITRAVPAETLYEICEKYATRIRNSYAGAWGPLQQVLRVSNSPDDAECISDTFDWHCPQHRDWYDNETVAAWFELEGFTVDRVGDFPTCISGTKIRGGPKARPRRGTTPRVLLVSDVEGWAFDQNMQDMAEYLGDRFDFEHGYVSEWQHDTCVPNMDDYDAVFALYHRWGIEHLLPKGRTLGALRAQWIFPEKRRRCGKEEFDLVNSYCAYQVVTRQNLDELLPHCPNVVYLTNPVNTRRFPEPTPKRDILIATWNGNAGHTNKLNEDVKGFHSIIVPVCLRLGVKLEYAEYRTKRLMPSEMPQFYQQGNVALCASLYEGASNSVMEGMAAGQAVIATDVGNHREMQRSQFEAYGDTGIVIVGRSQEAFADAIEELSNDLGRVAVMGDLNRKEIERAWSWRVWADRYAEFLLKGC